MLSTPNAQRACLTNRWLANKEQLVMGAQTPPPSGTCKDPLEHGAQRRWYLPQCPQQQQLIHKQRREGVNTPGAPLASNHYSSVP